MGNASRHRRLWRYNIEAMIEIAAIPPTTPPARPPKFERCTPIGEGVAVFDVALFDVTVFDVATVCNVAVFHVAVFDVAIFNVAVFNVAVFKIELT